MNRNDKNRKYLIIPSFIGTILGGLYGYMQSRFAYTEFLEKGFIEKGFNGGVVGSFILYFAIAFVIVFIITYVIQSILLIPIEKIILNNNKAKTISKFKSLYQSHSKEFNDIKSFNKSKLEVDSLSLNNSDKYEYYHNKETEKLISDTEVVVNQANNFIDTIEKSLNIYNRNIEARYNILSNYLGLEELLQFSKILVSDFKDMQSKYQTDKIGISIGKKGEDLVDKTLAMYDHKLINLSNMRFEVDNSSIETDNLVISSNGVFSIEVKNLGISGKYSIKIDKDGKWSKVYPNKVESMGNVTAQTYRHVALTEKLLNKELAKKGYEENIDVIPLIVFANDTVNIENNSDITVIRASNIYNEISKINNNLNKKMIYDIRDTALLNTLPSKEYPVINIVDKSNIVLEELNNIISLLKRYKDMIIDVK